MLGEFLTRCLVLLFGFAYPAFECFKSVERKSDDIHELGFWCQYWIIVAIFSVCERMADICFAWLPVYDEVKLGFIIYLWYSKPKGAGYIYDTVLRPYMAQHEGDIEQKLQELKTRAWDLAIYYWQNCTQLGQTAIFQALDYLAAQSGRFTSSSIEEQQQQQQKSNNYEPNAPPMPPASEFPSTTKSPGRDTRRRPPRPPPPGGSSTTDRAVLESAKSKLFQFQSTEKMETLQVGEEDSEYTFPEADLNDEKPHRHHHTGTGRFLRRLKTIEEKAQNF